MSKQTTAQAQSYAVAVIADASGEWCRNTLRFATSEEAEEYAKDLEWRWTSVREYRVEPTQDPVNYVWKDGKSEPIGD